MSDEDLALCQCLDHEPETFDRLPLFLPIILIMFVSYFLLLAVANLAYGIQLGSLIPYTCMALLGTFSAQRGQQPYYFECPIVRQTLPQLARRHGIFLFALVLLETTALQLKPHLPDSWLIEGRRDSSTFDTTLLILCLTLGLFQVLSNRSLLERVHKEKRALT
jgi:hypothetical protein